jgi:hypothetical protein
MIVTKDFVVAAVGGIMTAAYIVVLDHLFPIGGPDAPIRALFVWSFLAMTAVGLVLGFFGNAVAIMLFSICGICVGAIAFATYDLVVHHVDHNLIPFEIVVDGVLLVPGTVVGVAVARSLRWLAVRSLRKSDGRLFR